MFCQKCGSELRDDALFCDKCGSKVKSSGSKSVPLGLTIACMCIGIIGVIVGIVMICVGNKALKESAVSYVNVSVENNEKPQEKVAEAKNAEMDYTSVSEEVKKTEQEIQEEKEELKNSITKFFEGEPVLELPSLETFSKGRLILGDYEEDKATGGYVQYFLAGSDVTVVNCFAEYKDVLASYGVTVTGTLSSNDGEYNYTCFPCSYSGDSSIERGSISYEGVVECDFCFVTASKDGEAYIAAYIPEGVTFIETTDKMKNSY